MPLASPPLTAGSPRAPPAAAAATRAFDRDNFARRFLSVAQRLDSLRAPAPGDRRTTSAEAERATAEPAPTPTDADADVERLLVLLDAPRAPLDVFRRNERFRPSERVASASSSAAAAVKHAASRKLSLGARDASGCANAPTSAPTSAPAPAPSLVAVGGTARALPAVQLARITAALRTRRHALASLQPAASASPELRRALRTAPGSTWEALRSSAAAAAAAPRVEAADAAAAAASSKQALIAELVRRTDFSTRHIFHLSRRFKAAAGAARSAMAFDEFRRVMGEDLSALLGGAEATGDADGAEPAATELAAIGATIASSDTFLRRLFLAFDADGDGHIDVREFIVGLSAFARGSPEDKVAALFEVYRSDRRAPGDGSPRVAISDLLGLFQGDRQLYAELMRSVDDYFVRVELRTEANGDGDEASDGRMTEDEFAAASLEEPHLLDRISRPLPSRRYAADERVRELVRRVVELERLGWRRLLGLHRALVTWASRSNLQASDEPPAVVLPAADFLKALRGEASSVRAPADDALVQSLLLAYMAPPSGDSGDSGGASAAGASAEQALVPHVAGSELAQDLAVALLSTFAAAPDAEAKARFFFSLFDADRDGLLSRADLSRGVCAGFAHFGRAVMEVVRALEDEDADQDGELSEAEYLRAARKSPAILASLYTCL